MVSAAFNVQTIPSLSLMQSHFLLTSDLSFTFFAPLCLLPQYDSLMSHWGKQSVYTIHVPHISCRVSVYIAYTHFLLESKLAKWRQVVQMFSEIRQRNMWKKQKKNGKSCEWNMIRMIFEWCWCENVCVEYLINIYLHPCRAGPKSKTTRKWTWHHSQTLFISAQNHSIFSDKDLFFACAHNHAASYYYAMHNLYSLRSIFFFLVRFLSWGSFALQFTLFQ